MFLIGNNLVWTKHGLRRVKEVEGGYQILGIDRKGHPLWSKLDSSPVLKGKKELLIHMILDRSEIIVAPTCELCGREGILRAEEMKEGDKLEVFSDPKYISRELRKPPPDLVDKIYLKGYGAIPLTTEKGYLLGILSQCTKVPALWSTGVIIIRVPKDGAEWTTQRLKEVIHDFNLISIREGRYWDFIEFRSHIIDLVPHLPPLKTIITKVLRSHYSVLHGFIKGFIDARTVLLENSRRIVTKMEEIELRKLLYNLFFIHSIRCFTNVIRYRAKRQMCHIHVPFSDLNAFYKGKILSRALGAWTEIKEIYKIKEEMYAFPQSEKIYWSPVIDLVLLAC